MISIMPDQDVTPRVRLLANVAAKRLLSRVRSLMTLEMLGFREPPLAIGTLSAERPSRIG